MIDECSSLDRSTQTLLSAPHKNDLFVTVRPEIEQLAPYAPGESLQEFSQRTGIELAGLCKLNCNESPYGPVEAVKQALQNHEWYNLYPDTQSRQLKAALADYSGLHEDAIVVGHGTMELISLLWSIFLAPGDEILRCTPTFSFYVTAAAQCGARLVSVKRTAEYEIDVDAIIAALTERTKIIVLCSPNNPTGNVLAEEDLV